MAGKVVPEIVIDGDTLGQVAALTLDQPWNGHHSFSVSCPLREKKDSILELSKKYIGKEILIKLTGGILAIGGELIFKGLVTSVRLSKQEGSLMQIVYSGYSPTLLLDDGPHLQSFLEKKFQDIVGDVVGKFAIDSQVDPRYSDPLPYTTQYHETAFAFLQRLHATYGEWLYYDGEKLICGKPAEGEEKPLHFGRGLTGLELSAQIVPTNFKLMGYNYVEHEHTESPAGKAKVAGLDKLAQIAADVSEELFKNEPTVLSLTEAKDKAVLDTFSHRRKSASAGKLVNLYGHSERFDLRVGDIVQVDSPGGTLGIPGETMDYGAYRILRVTHHLDGSGNYENSFQAIVADLEHPPRSTEQVIRSPSAEPQAAEIIENHDPEEMGRVQVQFPWQQATNDHTPWLRVAASGAGGSHGAYFVPEKGDQVFIGFEYNNPDRPYVMGSLYHGKSKPAGLGDPDNNSKAIKTRSGNQIKLSDEGGNESILIENGHNTITLSLSGSGSIAISTDGDLSLSAKNITISAGEKLNISSGKAAKIDVDSGELSSAKALTVTAGTKAEISAMDVTVKAETAVKVEGGATADLTSPKTTVNGDAMTTVQGAMVMLN